MRANQCGFLAVANLNANGTCSRPKARFGRRATGSLRVPSAPIQRQRRIGCELSPSYRRIEARCVDPVSWLNQESRAFWGFRLAAWVFAASVFTRPVSAATWSATVMTRVRFTTAPRRLASWARNVTGRGSCGQARQSAAPLRSALTVTAPLSVAGGGGRDEGRPGKISTTCGASKARAGAPRASSSSPYAKAG
jgi:hypothetical protein